ncbi:MAG: hypothetical protein Q8N45_11665, partial [Anaerolineales bacterium]|nr:hypothetical protein [Anaerolineales bacterium]
MAELLQYAQLAGRVYNRTPENRTPVPDGWSELNWQKDDGVSGFSAGAYRKGNEVVISFTGTNETMWKDFAVANIPAGWGLSSAQITQAMTFVLDTMKANPGTTITLTGHSLGGGLASVMAVFFDLQATIFDPAPFELSARNPVVLGGLQAYLLANDYNNSAFDEYSQSLGTLFSQRETKVRSYYLDGEVLEALRVAVPVIAGAETEISAGNPSILDTANPLKLFGASVTMHSMTLLHSIMLSPSFAEAVKQQRRAIEVFFDTALYAKDPQTSDQPDFMNLMLNKQLTDGSGSQGMLNALADDLLRIDKIGTAGTKEINLGILAALTEYYRYLEAPDQQGFVESIDGGIELDLSRIAGNSDHRGQETLLRQIRTWMGGQGEKGITPGSTDRVIIQSGSGGLQADQAGDDKSDLMIGASQEDVISGGGGNDFLVGLNGADNFSGNEGNDDLYGGEGDDILEGGQGVDRLYGGTGADTYRFSSGDGIDLIYDTGG